MLRYHDEIGFYDLVISADVIEKYKNKFHAEKKEDQLNLNHSAILQTDAKMTQSFLINDLSRKQIPDDFKDLPDGTWMIELTFESEKSYNEFEKLGLKGFSIEGTFPIVGDDGIEYIVTEKLRIMNKLSDFLPFNIYVQGGSTDGSGRNEHGEAHFELKQKNTNKPLGKIFMPSLSSWTNLDFKKRIDLMKVHGGIDIATKDKKAMARWLELKDNENLIRCHTEWNECNKFNNRVTLI